MCVVLIRFISALIVAFYCGAPRSNLRVQFLLRFFAAAGFFFFLFLILSRQTKRQRAEQNSLL